MPTSPWSSTSLEVGSPLLRWPREAGEAGTQQCLRLSPPVKGTHAQPGKPSRPRMTDFPRFLSPPRGQPREIQQPLSEQDVLRRGEPGSAGLAASLFPCPTGPLPEVVREGLCHQKVTPLSPTDSLLRLPDGQLQGLGQAHPSGGEQAGLQAEWTGPGGREAGLARPCTPNTLPVPVSSVMGLT